MLDLSPYQEALYTQSLLRRVGRVERVTGLIIESNGPTVGLGDLCRLHISKSEPPATAEVVGFRHGRVQLMALTAVDGIRRGTEVVATRRPFRVPVGEALLGRTVNAWGRPIDDGDPISFRETRSVVATPPPAMSRRRIDTALATGVRVIDGLLPVGRGQRLGIFAGSGVGKSTLLGMLSRHSDADVNVIALVGERGREVRDFVERGLGPDGRARSVVVVATSDAPALVRVKAALTAMTMAEAFRDQGKNVTLVMDSVTRTAMALREIGLAVGEPPTSRGYTPSVFAFLAPYLERAGQSAVGSITAFATVLVEGDDMNDPVADAVRGILDGHVVLSRSLANRNHFPAVDVLDSVSRLAPRVADAAHARAAGTVREALATHAHYEDLITVGAYRPGQNEELDRTMAALPAIHAFLRQEESESTAPSVTRSALLQLEASIKEWVPARGEEADG